MEMLAANLLAQPLSHLFIPSLIQQILPKTLTKRVLWPTL